MVQLQLQHAALSTMITKQQGPAWLQAAYGMLVRIWFDCVPSILKPNNFGRLWLFEVNTWNQHGTNSLDFSICLNRSENEVEVFSLLPAWISERVWRHPSQLFKRARIVESGAISAFPAPPTPRSPPSIPISVHKSSNSSLHTILAMADPGWRLFRLWRRALSSSGETSCCPREPPPQGKDSEAVTDRGGGGTGAWGEARPQQNQVVRSVARYTPYSTPAPIAPRCAWPPRHAPLAQKCPVSGTPPFAPWGQGGGES